MAGDSDWESEWDSDSDPSSGSPRGLFWTIPHAEGAFAETAPSTAKRTDRTEAVACDWEADTPTDPPPECLPLEIPGEARRRSASTNGMRETETGIETEIAIEIEIENHHPTETLVDPPGVTGTAGDNMGTHMPRTSHPLRPLARNSCRPLDAGGAIFRLPRPSSTWDRTEAFGTAIATVIATVIVIVIVTIPCLPRGWGRRTRVQNPFPTVSTIEAGHPWTGIGEGISPGTCPLPPRIPGGCRAGTRLPLDPVDRTRVFPSGA
mmetsp:Transcript_2953/g.8065  ORF Transcript_2953/g.8065 Transcript_2953/m.8065 type:complete len:264 (+) Transcript_2953:564-1355(+)